MYKRKWAKLQGGELRYPLRDHDMIRATVYPLQMLKTFLVILVSFGIMASVVGHLFPGDMQLGDDEAYAGSKRRYYVALGDSYSIGEGVLTRDRWPNLLERSLRKSGINIRLVANPSRTGWTTQQVLEREMVEVEKKRPDFVTLMIGVNDWVQGVPEEVFRDRFVQILQKLSDLMTTPNILVVTIPDYTKTPLGSQFGSPELNVAGIQRFNTIITEESSRRDIPVVDVFALSQTESQLSGGLAEDGLHPSPQQYQAWERVILPEALKILR